MAEILAPKAVNRGVSRLASMVSWACVEFPTMGNLIIGGDDRVQRVRYRVVDLISTDDSLWANFKGNPKVTRLPIPRLYISGDGVKRERLVGVTQVHHEAFGVLPLPDMCVPAIAWRLGDAVLATEITREDLRRIAIDGYGMRIGHDDLHTTVGCLIGNGEDEGLIIPPGVVTARTAVDIDKLSKDICIY